ALDRLHVEDRDDCGEVRHVRLDQQRRRQDRLAPETSLLVLIGVARGAEEPVAELTRELVRTPRAERDRSILRIDSADRLVPEGAFRGQTLDDLRPLLRVRFGAQSTSTRSSRPSASS